MDQTRPGVDESISDAEYDRLEAILDGLPGEDAMDLEEMDGFFAALICGPVTVSPGEYLNEIWGEEEAPFETVEDLEEFFSLAIRHWNSIAHALASSDQTFMAWLIPEEGEEIPRGNRWARGFQRAILLRRDTWDELFKDDDRFAMLLPIFALAHENDPDPEMRTWKTAPEPELREKVLIGLSVAAQKLFDYLRSHRTSEAGSGQTGPRKTMRKMGRNDPCYCGSGKKYKRCCGNVTIN
jgi:uncharacterized protein